MWGSPVARCDPCSGPGEVYGGGPSGGVGRAQTPRDMAWPQGISAAWGFRELERPQCAHSDTSHILLYGQSSRQGDGASVPRAIYSDVKLPPIVCSSRQPTGASITNAKPRCAGDLFRHRGLAFVPPGIWEQPGGMASGEREYPRAGREGYLEQVGNLYQVGG